jgi:hypothetical protein
MNFRAQSRLESSRALHGPPPVGSAEAIFSFIVQCDSGAEMANPIAFIGDVDDNDAVQTRTNRADHILNLPAAAALAKSLKHFGGWGEGGGDKMWAHGLALKILGPAVKLTRAARRLKVLKWQLDATAINRVVVVLTAEGVFDREYATFAEYKEAVAETVKGATPQLLRDLTVTDADFFETAAPDDALPGGQRGQQWSLELTYGDPDAFGIIARDDDSAEAAFDLIYALGPCFTAGHFATNALAQTRILTFFAANFDRQILNRTGKFCQNFATRCRGLDCR